jgi:hypothetical protein
MDNINQLRLGLRFGLALGIVFAACDDGGDDRDDAGAVTAPATSVGSTDPTGASDDDEGGEESDSGGPVDDTNGAEASTSSDPPPPATSAGDEGGEESGGEESGGSPTTGVRGAVIRSVAPAAGQDGIGTLYVGLLVQCTADSEQAGGATPVMGADLSAEGSQALYEVTGVAPGTYYLVAFLDDNLNADPNNPYADNADLVTADGFAPGCVEVTIVEGQMANAPAPVNLNLVYPL